MSEPASTPRTRIDAANRFCVSANGEYLRVLMPPMRHVEITRGEAVNLAAWLCAMAGPDSRTDLDRTLEAILKI